MYSLGGNSSICMIANISPSVSALEETVSTLNFASQAKQIKFAQTANEDTPEQNHQLRSEIEGFKTSFLWLEQLISA